MSELNPRRPARSPFDDIRHVDEDPQHGPFEWWSAREMVSPLGYDRWERFQDVIDRAKAACRNSGYDVTDHFRSAGKMVQLGSGGVREVEDYHLTRFACYLTAMNGDPRKPEIAAAQRYFAFQTYRAEQLLPPPGIADRNPTPPQQELNRPWATRFRDTFGDHYRHVHLNHPAGSFSVVTAGLMPMLHLEDELLIHMMPIQSGDRPCISIGLTWANWLRAEGRGAPIGYSPLWLPEQQMPADVAVYGGELRVTFDVWLHNIYMPRKLPPYMKNKKDFKHIGPLPKASVADRTCRFLTGRPAELPGAIAHELEARGGFVPYRPLPGGSNPPPAITG
jgi:hypothetical protein